MERYVFVDSRETRKELMDNCETIIKNVQEDIREYFTFDIKLIGSGENRLITYDQIEDKYDLDFNLIIQRDKQHLINSPKEIKKIFMNSFNKFTHIYEYSFSHNSKSVITIDDNDDVFSFDVAILVKANNGNYLKIIYDKDNERYIWNEIKKSSNATDDFKLIKQQKLFPEFKKIYLKKKNNNLNIKIRKPSYSIFLETIKEIKDKYNIYD